MKVIVVGEIRQETCGAPGDLPGQQGCVKLISEKAFVVHLFLLLV